MRKRITGQDNQQNPPAGGRDWLDLENLVTVELSSEEENHTIESALRAETGGGWRAQQPGEQTIRLLFDVPHRIRRIQLEFRETERQRTQEFVLRWSGSDEAMAREIVRQQYNFSPPGSSREVEDYVVDLDGLTMLELCIVPDISGGEARASLAQLRLA